MQYKTVAGPAKFIVKKGWTDSKTYESIQEVMGQYSDLIDKESVGGWELFFIQQVPIVEQPGCIQALLKVQPETWYWNMLVFKKE